eukprot:464019-Alexandrium_andersonii.AAC.1
MKGFEDVPRRAVGRATAPQKPPRPPALGSGATPPEPPQPSALGSGATPPEPPQPPAPRSAQPTGYVRELGPEPSKGWARSWHGFGVPFRPGVVPPRGKRRSVAAKVDEGCVEIQVDVLESGKTLIAALRNNLEWIWNCDRMDPAGW